MEPGIIPSIGGVLRGPGGGNPSGFLFFRILHRGGRNISAGTGKHKAGTTKPSFSFAPGTGGRMLSHDMKFLSQEKENNDMASNQSSSGSKKILVPEARAAMNQFKMEAANEVDVPSSY